MLEVEKVRKNEFLKSVIEYYCDEIRKKDSSILSDPDDTPQWPKAVFRSMVNGLHMALKYYGSDKFNAIRKRVNALRWSMIFMSASRAEDEAHLLAAELERFLQHID